MKNRVELKTICLFLILAFITPFQVSANPVFETLQNHERWIGSGAVPHAATGVVTLGDQLMCTRAHLPERAGIEGLEFSFHNYTQDSWVSAYWGDISNFERDTHHLGPIIFGSSALTELIVDPALHLPAGSSSPTDDVSPGAWTIYFEDGNIQTWVDNCFVDRAAIQIPDSEQIPDDFLPHFDSASYTLAGGEAVCTKAYFPDDAGEISNLNMALRLQRNGVQTMLYAHIDTVAIEAANLWHEFRVDLETEMRDQVGQTVVLREGDVVSPSIWQVERGNIVEEIWTSNCILGAELVGPEIQFIGGNPRFISSLDLFDPNTAAQCTDNIDTTCVTTNNFASAVLNPGSDGLYSITYTATDSEGNTEQALLELFVDGTPPVIDLIRDPIEHTAGQPYEEIAECTDDKTTCEILVDVTLSSGFDTLAPEVGTYSVPLSAIDGSGNQTTAGSELIRNINVLPAAPVALAGKLNNTVYQVSSGVIKALENNIDLSSPLSTEVVDFESRKLEVSNGVSSKGQFMKGYLTPDQTGWHTFWIASKDESRLVLSTDSTANNKRVIAKVENRPGRWQPHFTEPYEWFKYPINQESEQVWLTAGQRYYLEIIYVSSSSTTANSHVEVAWRKPGEEGQPPEDDSWLIPSSQLSLFEDNGPVIKLNTPENMLLTAGEVYFESAICYDAEDGTCELETSGSVESGSTPDLGTYTLTYDATDSVGNTATTVTRTLEVIEDESSLIATGTITHKVFEGVNNDKSITNLLVHPKYINNNPDQEQEISQFKATYTNAPGQFGQVIRGLLVAPETGEYTFWISSNDASRLYLSSDDTAANKDDVAEVPGTGYTSEYQWSKAAYGSAQKSAPQSLVKGQAYYIEAVNVRTKKKFTANSATGRVSVAWRTPSDNSDPVNGSADQIIPGTVLAPEGEARD